MTLSIPKNVDATAGMAARESLQNVREHTDTLSLVSGGHDSLTAMHVAQQSDHVHLDGIVHINTGIGISDTRAFVRQRAHELGLDYYEVGRPEPIGDRSEFRPHVREYRYLIRQYGFPGPAVHDKMYINLKHEPLKAWLDAHYPDRELTLVSGVRRHESERRMENVDETGVQDYLGCTTVSPIVEFTGLDVTRYRAGLDLPSNPVVDALEMSGECLCGAFANRGELRMLRIFYPDMWRRIKCLEAMVSVACCHEDGPDERYARWGHNRLHDRERDVMDDDAQTLLCSTCEARHECDSAKPGDKDGCDP